MSNFLRHHGLQHARLPCPSFSPRVYSNWCPLSRQCHPTILSSVTPSPPAFSLSSRCFPMILLFASGGQNIGASASVHPMNIYSWFPLGLTDLISLLSKGLSQFYSGSIFGPHLWSIEETLTWVNWALNITSNWELTWCTIFRNVVAMTTEAHLDICFRDSRSHLRKEGPALSVNLVTNTSRLSTSLATEIVWMWTLSCVHSQHP